jgi:hypothetical protein
MAKNRATFKSGTIQKHTKIDEEEKLEELKQKRDELEMEIQSFDKKQLKKFTDKNDEENKHPEKEQEIPPSPKETATPMNLENKGEDYKPTPEEVANSKQAKENNETHHHQYEAMIIEEGIIWITEPRDKRKVIDLANEKKEEDINVGEIRTFETSKSTYTTFSNH